MKSVAPTPVGAVLPVIAKAETVTPEIVAQIRAALAGVTQVLAVQSPERSGVTKATGQVAALNALVGKEAATPVAGASASPASIPEGTATPAAGASLPLASTPGAVVAPAPGSASDLAAIMEALKEIERSLAERLEKVEKMSGVHKGLDAGGAVPAVVDNFRSIPL